MIKYCTVLISFFYRSMGSYCSQDKKHERQVQNSGHKTTSPVQNTIYEKHTSKIWCWWSSENSSCLKALKVTLKFSRSDATTSSGKIVKFCSFLIDNFFNIPVLIPATTWKQISAMITSITISTNVAYNSVSVNVSYTLHMSTKNEVKEVQTAEQPIGSLWEKNTAKV